MRRQAYLESDLKYGTDMVQFLARFGKLSKLD